MPINKAARLRFEIIDECLRNTKKKWSKTELLNYINRRLELSHGAEATISVSQLRYDLASMETEYGAPIQMYSDGRQRYYRYEDAGFSIKALPVGEEDLAKLNDAVQLLQQIRGFTIADDIAEIVRRLESRYQFVDNHEQRMISFESSPEMEGIENLSDIYQAVVRKNVLKIGYQTFKDEHPTEWIMHPYLLKEYDHRWYLLGYVAEKGQHRVFALDRMKTIKVVRQKFIENETVDSEDYFRDMIGVTLYPGSKAEEIELMFSPLYAPYMRTRPMHHSQRILRQDEDGSLYVRLNLIINPELLTLLMGFGKDVKVLQPAHLVAQLISEGQTVLRQYEADGNSKDAE